MDELTGTVTRLVKFVENNFQREWSLEAARDLSINQMDDQQARDMLAVLQQRVEAHDAAQKGAGDEGKQSNDLNE